ncbi:hypothetical protein SKDZ_06G0420 [Saccharomyces kudriavzevii ZP591]|nr:hypothetical protein SKDZ_06G0420 [Saccharomyces kudriavzevii ZP591]
MDVLAGSVANTLKNLRGKRDFLAEQRKHYISIRGRLISFNSGNDSDDEGAESPGLVFGDIIISARRIYLSIGYEYYVEKSKEEAVAFVDDKLKLMDDAVEQFDIKIEEAKRTLHNLNSIDAGAGDGQEEMDNEEDFLASVEIREELDEEGNVISSTVTPTTKQSPQPSTKEEEEVGVVSQKEEHSTKEKKSNSFEENLKGKLSNKSTEVKRVVEPSKVDTENVYTFADLVQQMDKQDELEDGSIGIDEINYDYDAYENSNFKVYDYNSEEHEGDEEFEDDEEYAGHSIIPGFEAQSSFLKQIQRLREQKQAQGHKQVTADGSEPLKPILKKSSTIEEPAKKHKKKQVGFASSLEIHEVENLKEENKRQMRSFSIPTYDIINNQEIMGPANEMASDEFDGDLFAKMLGVQEADEVHDKYKDEVENQQEQEDGMSRPGRKDRVSRFKKDRASRKQDAVLNHERIRSKPSVEGGTVQEQSAVSDVIEREPVVGNIVEGKPAADNYNKFESLLEKKNLKSLQKPKSSKSKKEKFDPKMFEDVSDDDDDDIDDDKKPGANRNESSADEEKFPSKIQEVSRSMAQTGATIEGKPIKVTNVDYHALGGDMDDMVKAYSLGLYDDDLEEDPGTIVEKLEDFKEYNRQVELLREEIRDFQLENPPHAAEAIEETDDKIMVDVVEREFPESYADDADEVVLHPDRLQEAVAIEYRRLKETAALKWQSSSLDTHSEGELEPIDEFGNPVSTSRFRSQRLHMDITDRK